MRFKVVVCGSYHKDPVGLARIFRELETTGCRILSPISLDFTNINEAMVKTKNEYDLSVEDIEKYHLRAIRDADFIWLHTPGGHIGISGSFEIGYANAFKKPIFCYRMPDDEMLSTRVTKINSVFEAIEYLNFTTPI
jgi:hypothetical protein